MKLKILTSILTLALACSLNAGSQSWENSCTPSDQFSTGTSSFYTTSSTEFLAEIYGTGAVAGMAKAYPSSGSGGVLATIYSPYGGYSSDSGTIASGKTVKVERIVYCYFSPGGGYGTSKVTASW